MPTIRDQILTELTTRLDSISDDWRADMRGPVNDTGDHKVRAHVAMFGESKTLATNLDYQVRANVIVLVIARVEDATAELDADPVTGEPNAYRYLDRRMAEAESAVHTPEQWNVQPDYTDVTIDAIDFADADDEGEVQGIMRLTFNYRHDFQDPSK